MALAHRAEEWTRFSAQNDVLIQEGSIGCSGSQGRTEGSRPDGKPLSVADPSEQSLKLRNNWFATDPFLIF
jgi:hypothetical protein